MPGDANGAKLVLATLAPLNTVPKSWNEKGQGPKDVGNGYRLTTYTPQQMNSDYGMGRLQWGHFTPEETIQFKWNKNTRKIEDDSKNIPDPGYVKELPLLGFPDAIASGVSTIPELIEKITNPALWKRIGLVSLGVLLVILAFIFVIKRET